VLLVAAVAAVAVPAARADGDPASDYLLGLKTFIPSDTAISSADSGRLTALVTAARRGGYTVRVAVIASRYDMGSVTILYKRPLFYAPFLSQELRFVYPGRVLVVMPNGYGIARAGRSVPDEQKVLDKLPLPAAGRGAPPPAATGRAVRALAAHAGVKVASQPIAAAGSSGSTTTRDRLLIAGGAAVLLLAGGGVWYFRSSRGAAASARRRKR